MRTDNPWRVWNLASVLHLNLVAGPWIIFVVWWALMLTPSTRWRLISFVRDERERGVIEITTVVLFFCAAAIAVIRLWRSERPRGLPTVVATVFFAALALLAAGEEASWGQHLLGFATPDFVAERNAQGELTLHNLDGVHGNAGKMYLAFCVGAVIALSRRLPVVGSWTWANLRAPRHLWSLTLVIMVLTLTKLWTEWDLPVEFLYPDDVNAVVRWTTELTEMLIALWAFLYAVRDGVDLPEKLRDIWAPAIGRHG